MNGADTDRDLFRLENLNAGNAVSLTILTPAGAALDASQMMLGVERRRGAVGVGIG